MDKKKKEIRKIIDGFGITGEGWKYKVHDLNITQNEVKKVIQESENTTPGPDNIPISFMKGTISWSSFMIHLILVSSLETGVVPWQLKNANVSPLIKDETENCHTFKNFRPISITSIVARIMEKVIKKRVSQSFNIDKVIPDCQFGGRPGMGTIDALTYVWTNIMNNN